MLGKCSEDQKVLCTDGVGKRRIEVPRQESVKREGALLNKTSNPTGNYKDWTKGVLTVDRQTNLTMFPQV